MLVVPELGWDEYQGLLVDLAECPHLRLSYDSGRLEIVSPLPKHEEYARFIEAMIVLYSDVLGVEIESYGQTTWRKRALRKGVEADGGYYARNARRVIGKPDIDLDVDSPPDIAVEIDTTNASQNKLPIYAALSVPEIWRYDGISAQIYELKEGVYTGVAESRFCRVSPEPFWPSSLN
jgi:Uma2 family endonuclease